MARSSKRDDFTSEFLFSLHSVPDRSDLTSCSYRQQRESKVDYWKLWWNESY